jgi:hypothetical protein
VPWNFLTPWQRTLKLFDRCQFFCAAISPAISHLAMRRSPRIIKRLYRVCRFYDSAPILDDLTSPTLSRHHKHISQPHRTEHLRQRASELNATLCFVGAGGTSRLHALDISIFSKLTARARPESFRLAAQTAVLSVTPEQAIRILIDAWERICPEHVRKARAVECEAISLSFIGHDWFIRSEMAGR